MLLEPFVELIRKRQVVSRVLKHATMRTVPSAASKAGTELVDVVALANTCKVHRCQDKE
jgi:hypothetical protein